MFQKWSFLSAFFIALCIAGFGNVPTADQGFPAQVNFEEEQKPEFDQTPLIVVGYGSKGYSKECAKSCSKECTSTSKEAQKAKTCQPAPKECYILPIIEAKVGYFFFTNSKMRNVYSKGGIDVQLSGSYPVWKWLQIYGSVEFIERHGKSLHGHQKTRIWMYPLSLGLKATAVIIPEVQYYFTIGPRYFFAHVHNNSHFVDKTLNGNSLGGFVGTGFNFFPVPHFLIDVFGEYSYDRMHFHAHKGNVHGRTVQVGGFAFGVGVGYGF